MTFRRILFLTTMLVLTVSARAKVFDMANYGKVSFDLPSHWKASTEDVPSRGFRITFHPASGENILCRVFIYYYPNQDWFSDAPLMHYVGEACKQIAVGSVEKAVNLQRFRLDNGFGYYASFTDPKLVNRVPGAGDFAKITSGMICLNGRIVMTVSIYSETTDSPGFKQAMKMLRTAHFVFPKNSDNDKRLFEQDMPKPAKKGQ